ncbi:hypothetical protein IAD21_05763 [Abditibacteriota bacterium]|nr:hypothetical protein IAD21_05763 [Abditibacteriota bacterium]
MNKTLLIFLGLIGALLIALLGGKLYINSQSEAQYEAVVRDIGENTQTNANAAGAKILFVSIQKQDPSPEFLARFQGATYAVRPGSRALGGQRFSGSLTKDNQTGESGLEVRITSTIWTGFDKAVVYANGYGFVVTNESGSWRVKYVTMMVVG